MKDVDGSTSNIVDNILSSIENKIKNSLITGQLRSKHQYIEKNNHMFVQMPIKKKVVINFIQGICREVFITEVLSDKDLIGKVCIEGKKTYCVDDNTKLEQAMLIVQNALKNIDGTIKFRVLY